MTGSATEGATQGAGEASPVRTGGLRAALCRHLRGARWSLRLLGLAVVVALALPLLLVGREVTAPSWVRERVEAAAAEALGGGALRFGAITVRVPGDLHPEVRLLDVTLTDRAGRLLARVPEAEAQLSPRGLLFERRPLVQEIALSGAELSLSRAEDGTVDLAFGSGQGRQGGWRAAGLASLPDRFEALFERPALEALRQVRVSGLVVNYDDARAGRSWTLDGGELALDLSGGMARLSGGVTLLSGRSYVTRARVEYESPRGSPAARFGVTLTDVAAEDVASQGAALTWLRVVDAPISMALRVELDEAGALGPLDVALKIAKGRLRPHPGTKGVGFDHARAYLSYDPEAMAVRFDTVEVRSDWGGVLAEGQAYLREFEDGMPRALLGQFALADIAVAPPGLETPAHLPGATAQFRLRLDPFTVEIADASLGLPGEGTGRLGLRGRIGASAEGWEVALDARLAAIARDRIMALWPERFRPGLRDWIEANLAEGTLRDLAGAFRLRPGAETVVALTAGFEGASLRPLPTHPPITGASGRMTWEGGAFTVALDGGEVVAPEGGAVGMGGSSFVIPPGGGARPPAALDLTAKGPITAVLSLLDRPPYRFLGNAGLPVTLADGEAEAAGTVDLFLGPMQPGELRYDIAARLTGVRSEVLVPGRVLTADALAAAVTPEGIEVGGAMRVGSAWVEGAWRQGFAPEEKGRSSVEARVGLSPRVLREFGVLLPAGSVGGEGTGELSIAFAPGEDPAFALRSDLVGLSLAVPEVGWSKRPSRAGALEVEGTLGTPVRVERLALSAPGLSAEGSLGLTGAGSFDRLDLARLKVGDWLDAPVTLRARAGSDVPAVEVKGGSLDLGRAAFGGEGEGEGGPVTVALDRLQVTEGIALTGFQGVFGTESGLEGAFSGLVNGQAPVSGRVAPQGDRVAARIQGGDAGEVMEAAGLFTMAEGGALDLLLLPVGPASYDGEARIKGLRVRDAPVLASLLNAVSVVGLLQQLGGLGIYFDEVSADFRIDPDAVTVTRSSAMGAGLGLSMDGTFDLLNWRMDFQGVVSPFYLVNAIGSVLTRPGEGLVGFNFTLQGDPDDPAVGVNPLSALTPGMFRNIFRRPPPSLGQ